MLNPIGVPNPMRVRLLAAILGLAACVLSTAAWSQRQLPQDARFGEMTRFAYPQVVISKKTLHMAPGARIYNHQNLIIMPAAMPPRANVLFEVDTAGHLSGIWLLTAQEAARYKKPVLPTTIPPKPAPPKPAGPAKDEDKDDSSRLGGRN